LHEQQNEQNLTFSLFDVVYIFFMLYALYISIRPLNAACYEPQPRSQQKKYKI